MFFDKFYIYILYYYNFLSSILELKFYLKLFCHMSTAGLLKLWVVTPNGILKQIGIYCFVSQNFENPSSGAELLEKIIVIAHVIGKSREFEDKN